MPELLTARDVELKVFKKVSFGGYAVADVEEFLNQVAEDLEAYALRLNEQQHRARELEEALKRHEAMKDTIKDALILAQQSAKDKEDDAKRRADVILSKAEAKIAEFEAQGRRRLEEAEASADDIIAAARTSAAQVIKNAENMRDEAQRRLDNMETEISRRMAEANEKAADITAAARLEARRVVGKAKHEIEEGKKELSDLQLQRRRFLRETHELAASFSHLIDESIRRLDKGNSSWDDAPGSKIEEGASSHFSSIADDADETDIS